MTHVEQARELVGDGLVLDGLVEVRVLDRNGGLADEVSEQVALRLVEVLALADDGDHAHVVDVTADPHARPQRARERVHTLHRGGRGSVLLHRLIGRGGLEVGE